VKLHKCNVCGASTSLILFPDYTASGLWCFNCGVCYSNPQESLPDLPQNLIIIIEGWVELWDFSSCAFPDEINKDAFQRLIFDMGMELNKLINQHYFCIFDTERSQLDNPPRVNRQTGKWEHE
jgi:hypothetical protein